MDRAEKAVQLKYRGNNCCQAVMLAFAGEEGIPPENILKSAGACFGCGMGAFDATCGALCGAQMIMGLKNYAGRSLLKDAKELHGKFREACGSTYCAELKGLKGGKMLCSCDDCVRNAVRILEFAEK